MSFSWGRQMGRLGMPVFLVLAGLTVAGCHASFCAGSGCGAGSIDFGTSYKGHGGGNISIVGKKSTFKLGHSVAMVGHLRHTAGTKALELEAKRNGAAHSITINLPKSKVNVVGVMLAPANLAVLGVTHPGKYTFRLLRGSKQLAHGTMSEK